MKMGFVPNGKPAAVLSSGLEHDQVSQPKMGCIAQFEGLFLGFGFCYAVFRED
jgi:hypothetical protein